MKTIKCADLHAVGDLRFEEKPFPTRGKDEVMLRVKSCGICGSDIGRVYKKGTYHFPTVIGHEFSGEIADAEEKELLGKRAAVFPLLPCFSCESCRNEHYATCSHYDYYGSRRDGGMSEYIAVKKWNLVFMPEGLSYDEGAMCEPASVARHAALKLNIGDDTRLLIAGAGPIGLIVGKWAKLFGAKEVCFHDIDRKKLDFAKELGFSEYTGETPVDRFLEGTGCSDALKVCLAAAKPGARGVFMGNPVGDMLLPQDTYWQILRKELKIEGTWNSSYNDRQNDWKESLRAMADGSLDLKPLITHRYPLCECERAFEMMRDKKEFFVKVMLTMNREGETAK